MMSCHIIPKYIEDRVNSKHQNLKNSEISDELRSQHQILKFPETPEHNNKLTKNYVYNAKNRRRLPGTYVASSMSEVSASKDSDAIAAWTYSDYFLRFCREVLGRSDLNGLKSTIHYYSQYNNAFYNGQQMIYGDGDGVTFEDFVHDPSVVFHELWHIVTTKTCDLVCQDQSGALNESLSDVFASIIMQWMNAETIDEASWLIGDRCIIDIHNISYALRSLSDPGTAFINHPSMGSDNQPQDMSHYYSGTEDSGGIHINSGIPNRAFYLFAKAVGGYSWEFPCKIWYKTITTPGLISPNATFVEFAQATITAATELYALTDESIVHKLRNAWQTVKVL